MTGQHKAKGRLHDDGLRTLFTLQASDAANENADVDYAKRMPLPPGKASVICADFSRNSRRSTCWVAVCRPTRR